MAKSDNPNASGKTAKPISYGQPAVPASRDMDWLADPKIVEKLKVHSPKRRT